MLLRSAAMPANAAAAGDSPLVQALKLARTLTAGRPRMSGNESVADMQGATRRIKYVLDTLVAQVASLDAHGVAAAFLTLLEDTAEVEAAGWVEGWDAAGVSAAEAVTHFVGLVRGRFQPAGGDHVVASSLLRLRQTGPLQDFDTFVIEWFRLYNRAHGTLYKALDNGDDVMMTTLFLQSLADQSMAQAVLIDPAPKSPQKALEAIRSRRVFARARPAAAAAAPPAGTFAAVAAAPPAGTFAAVAARQFFDPSRLRKADGIPDALIQQRMDGRLCLWCGEAGHQRRHCERRKAEQPPVIPESFRKAAPK